MVDHLGLVGVGAHLGKAQQYGQKRVSKLREKPLSPNGRNDGS